MIAVQSDTVPIPSHPHGSRAPSPVPSARAAPHHGSIPLNPSSNPTFLMSSHHSVNSRRSSISSTYSADGALGPPPNRFIMPQRSQPQLNTKMGHFKNRKNRARSGSDEKEDSLHFSDGATSVAGSIAGACGMDIANAKRNQEFHALFRSVPEDDLLIEDYGCALQKEILLQGRMYISETHVCFNANIFGWVTNLVIAYADIIDIEKRTTAIIIPNAIQISTLQSKHFFASFLSRDQAFDQIVELWRAARQSSRPLINAIDNDTLDIDEDSSPSDSNLSSSTMSGEPEFLSDDTSSIDDLIHNDTVNKENHKPFEERQSSMASLPIPKHLSTEEAEAARRRAFSEAGSRPNIKSFVPENNKDGDKPHPLSRTRTDNAKDDFMPRKHIKTECQCLTGNQHFPHTVMDQTYQGSLETIYNLLYNSGFMKKFLTDVEKNTDITIGQWRKGEGNIKYVRDLSYVKYLGGSIGPKSTKCLLKEEVLHLDLNDYITQLTTTQTPDVPSGSAFCVKTRVCISWAGHEQVRVLVTVLVEFSKSSWLKSTIEKASIDGQLNYYKNLDAAVRKYTGSLSCKPNGSFKRQKSRTRNKHNKPSAKVHHDATGSNNHSRNLAHEATDPSSVVSFATSGLKWIINMILLPNPSQLTMLCMVSMVFINLYIATKMSRVHDRLDTLHAHHSRRPSIRSPLSASFLSPIDLPYSKYNQNAEDLWQWLGRLDPQAADAPKSSHWSVVNSHHHEKLRGSDTKDDHKPHYTADKIYHRMAELERMLKQAGQSLDQMTDMIQQQKQKIIQV